VPKFRALVAMSLVDAVCQMSLHEDDVVLVAKAWSLNELSDLLADLAQVVVSSPL
jgi:hypothetical protein